MKKQVKIMSIVLVVMMVLLSITNVVLAAPDLSSKIDQIGQGNESANTDKVIGLGQTVVTIMQTVNL